MPCSRERGRYPDDLLAQLGVTESPLAALLVPEDEGRMIVGVAEQVLGEVEPGAGEPAGAELRIGRRHPVRAR